MYFPLRIALRYIFTKRSFHFITVISVISLIGITIGVAALISVLSIFNGFRNFTEKQLIGFDPHIRIQAQQGVWIYNPDSLIHSLEKIKEIKYISALIQSRAVVIKSDNMQVFNLNSIDPKSLNNVSDITKSTILGTFYIGNINSYPAIALGAGLADRVKAMPGDTVSLISPTLIETSIRTFKLNNPIKSIVSSIFQTNDKNYDNLNAYINLQTGKKLFNPPPNSASTIDIKLFEIKKTTEVKNQIEKIMPDYYSVKTWYDLHKQLYRIIDLERLLAFLVMSLIIIIAVFNVLASLSMTVVEKKQDIGILKALGAGDKDIRNIFIFQGSIIGFISTSFGILLGLAFCYGQIHYSWFKLDGATFLISAIPVIVNIADVLIIAIFTLLLSIFASIYPANRASSTNIINSIHSE